MITVERYGVRADGNPVIETSTYIPAPPDHPLAVTLDGHEGTWVRIAVGNGLSAVGAQEVTEAKYRLAKDELRDKIERNELEARAKRQAAAEEIAAKKNEVRAELARLGLSPQTITAILDQVRQG